MAATLVLGDQLMFPSEFLTFADLKGRAAAVTIESISIDDLRTRQGKTRKVVIKMVGKEKKFVANKTNCQRIAEVYGNQANEWIDKVIVIKPDKDRFGGQMVDCIRVDTSATRSRSKMGPQQPEGRQQDPPHDPVTGEVSAGTEPGAEYTYSDEQQ
jgi:hypothetical protein